MPFQVTFSWVLLPSVQVAVTVWGMTGAVLFRVVIVTGSSFEMEWMVTVAIDTTELFANCPLICFLVCFKLVKSDSFKAGQVTGSWLLEPFDQVTDTVAGREGNCPDLVARDRGMADLMVMTWTVAFTAKELAWTCPETVN